MTDQPRVLALVGQANGSTLWRIWQPLAALQKQNYPAVWGWNTDTSLYLTANGAEIVVLPRLAWTEDKADEQDRFFGALKKARKCIVYEVDDDHFSDAFVRHLVKTEWKGREAAEKARNRVLVALKNCDGVTVSVPRLATVVRQLTDKPVHVVPNAIDLSWWRAVQSKALRVNPRLTIGWIGARRPEEDFAPMLEAWGNVAKKHRDVHFFIQGYHPKRLHEFVPVDRVTKLPFFVLEEYPLSFKSVDIGCCSLADNSFNRCKSDIKAQEYGASGAAIVASPTVYGKTIRDGKDGLIAETASDWTKALNTLVENARLRKRLASTFKRRIEKELCLEANLYRWPRAWRAIHEEFERERARNQIVIARR